jgi:2-oxo-3-hexenedioate decarboxylase
LDVVELAQGQSPIFSGGVTAPVPVVAGGSVTFEFDALGALEVYGA